MEMKTKLILALSICFMIQVQAQWINSVSVVPPNPTTTDSVFVILNADYSSGPCNDATQGFFQNGFTFNAFTLHCTGMLTVICTDEDTFQLGTLAAGNYTFNVQVDQGMGPSPCAPGIVPGPTGAVSFTVTSSSSINNPDISERIFLIANPSNRYVKLVNNGALNFTGKEKVRFFDIGGKQLVQISLSTLLKGVVLPFSSGIYIAEISVLGEVYKQKLVLN
jgi:hypothetical protein